jgi:OmpA-OmpF porin, OOP family
MKKLTFLSIIVLLMATFSVPAQNSDYKWAVGLNWNWVDFHTVHRSVPDQFKYTKWQGYQYPSAITLGRYLNPSFNVLGEFGISKLEKQSMSDLGQPLEDTKFWTGDLNLAYKFANGYILKQSSWFDPYIYLGLGVSNIKDLNTVNKTTYFKQVTGVGFNFWVLEKVGLNFQGSYDYDIAPKIEYEGTSKSNKRDDYMHFTAGVKFRLGVKDTDKDGVPDKTDLCPDVPGKVELAGCPDKDNDGIADKDDACPDVAGKPEFKGCPDTDGDGIIDKDDKCPTEAGKKELMGCPDKDGDGITDKEDKCPDVAGKKEFAGCPDTDGDGIVDSEDACPEIPGLAKFNGCPDKDGDGVADKDDKCPDVPGTIANNGCPEAPKFELYKVVYFGSDKNVMITKYTKDLDEVAAIMKEHTDVKVSVEGYADAQGNDKYNMRLSEKRADYVINYLVKKKIDKTRLVKAFYGEAKPAADNNSAEGRAQNRRVEIRAINK